MGPLGRMRWEVTTKMRPKTAFEQLMVGESGSPRIDAAFLDAHPELKLITMRSAGHDHIDVSECSRRGVIVCEVPGSNANTVAKHTFALMLALSRRRSGDRSRLDEQGFLIRLSVAWEE